MTRRAGALGLAVAVASLVALPARAQSAADLATARDLFAKAEKDEAKQDWTAALEKLRRAGAIKMTPGIRFHIALCEESTGKIVDALSDYLAAQSQARAENNKEVLEVVGESIEQLRPRVPTVKVIVPDDVGTRAEVKLDDKPLPPSAWGVVIPLVPGTHTVEAVAPGKAPFRTTVEAKEREATILDIKLVPAPAAAAAPAPAPSTAPSADTREGAVVEPPDEHGASGGGGARTGAIVATGAAVVLVGGGVASFAVAGSAQHDARTACAIGPCDADKTKVHVWDTIALGAWIAGGAAAVVAVVLWARPSRSHARAQSAVLRLGVGAGTIDLAGSFR